MSKIVKVQNGDYKIITEPGGTITLDVGMVIPTPAEPTGWAGGVIINGDLLVNGITTVIESETLTVKDNIIYINEGETGSGVVTLGDTAGIQIDRGTESDVSFLWDERIGAFVLVDSSYITPEDNLHESALALGARSILTGGSNLTLIGPNLGSAGSLEGVVDVAGTVNYEEKVLDYSLLNTFFEITRINRTGGTVTLQVSGLHGLETGDLAYVNCFPFPDISTGTTPVQIIKVSDTEFQYIKPGIDIPTQTFFAGFAGTVTPESIRSDDYIPNMRAIVDYTASAMLSFSSNKISQGDSRVIVIDDSIPDEFGNFQPSKISFDINQVNKAVINNDGLFVDNIQINNYTIKNKNSLVDKILLDSVIELKNKSGDPTVSPGYVSLYSKQIPGTGGTGLFFVNTEGTRDELISKTKALLYSLIL